MASRTGIYISGHYVVSINATPFHIRTFNSKNLKEWTKLYFILFIKLNDYQTRSFNIGLPRINPNVCKFELN